MPSLDNSGSLDRSRAILVSDLPTNQPATNIADGTVGDVEFQFLNGVTSSIQTQINSKISSSSTDILLNKTISDFSNLVLSDGEHLDVRNENGDMGIGDVVYISGYHVGSDRPEVTLADASVINTMPALGIVAETIVTNATGAICVTGRMSGVNTFDFEVGDSLYVSETAGEFINVRPTGSALVQKIATVLRKHASLGVIQIVALSRTNDIPNEITAFKMISNQHRLHTVGMITASTTQTQGQGALTGTLNEVETVANDNDTVTLQTADAGLNITVNNHGSNNLQIFPASGDDLGNGIDVPTVIGPNQSIEFSAFDATNWHLKSTTGIFHGEIIDEDNTDVFVINDVGSDHHAYHSNGLMEGNLSGFTFDIGGAGTSFPIASIADDGSGNILVTTTGSHLLAVDDIISQTNLADTAYVGFFKILTVPSATTYTVTATFTATDTGTMDQAATLNVKDIAIGKYKITWQASATTSSNNETFDFFLHKGVTTIVGSKTRRKFGTAADFGSFGGQALIDVISGDKLSFALANIDSAGNITIRDFSLIVIRL